MTRFSVGAGTTAAAPSTAGQTVRLAFIVAYEGSGFHGFAAQPAQATVAGALGTALERYLRHRVELTCAGRTDAGVHAWGQVVTFDARPDVDPAALQRAVNKALRPAVVVRDVAVVASSFDARRSATARRYRYTVLNRAVADPFLAPTSWHVEAPLDVRAMQLACDPLFGEHDFSSFCRQVVRRSGGASPPRAPLVRHVGHAGWSPVGNGMVRFEIEASSFCQQMVRAVVGTMVDVGLGRRRAGDMSGILRARDRAAAGQLAPPHGLCLWEVCY